MDIFNDELSLVTVEVLSGIFIDWEIRQTLIVSSEFSEVDGLGHLNALIRTFNDTLKIPVTDEEIFLLESSDNRVRLVIRKDFFKYLKLEDIGKIEKFVDSSSESLQEKIDMNLSIYGKSSKVLQKMLDGNTHFKTILDSQKIKLAADVDQPKSRP